MEPIFGFMLYFVAALIIAIVAGKRGRSGWLVFILCLVAGAALAVLAGMAGASSVGAGFTAFLAPIAALIWTLSAKSSAELAVVTGAHGDFRKCPSCAEPIRKEAIKCRYCGEAMESQVARTDWQ